MEQTYSGTFLKDRTALVLGGLVLMGAIVLALAVDTLASGGVDSPARVASSGAVVSSHVAIQGMVRSSDHVTHCVECRIVIRIQTHRKCNGRRRT